MSLTLKGSYFFRQTNGSRYYIRGVYYGDSGRAGDISTAFLDVLADDTLCRRDVPDLIALSINTLLVQDVDMTKDHTDCMRVFQAANISVMVMLNGRSPRFYLRNNQSFVSWDYHQIDFYRNIIDGFSKYPNTFGFFIGASKRSNVLPAKAKRAIIELKKYSAQNGYRKIPIGYVNSIHDVSASSMAEYMNCGNPGDSVDFYGWGRPLFKQAYCINSSSIFGNGVVEQYVTYSVPTFTLGGCQRKNKHSFSEIQQIFGEPGSDILSGIFIREWLDNTSNGADLGTYFSNRQM
jgi:hypothetical protein